MSIKSPLTLKTKNTSLTKGLQFQNTNRNRMPAIVNYSNICNQDAEGRQRYDNEIFVAGNERTSLSNIPTARDTEDLLERISYYDQDITIEAVQCIQKDDGSYFTSLPSIANIKIVNSL